MPTSTRTTATAKQPVPKKAPASAPKPAARRGSNGATAGTAELLAVLQAVRKGDFSVRYVPEEGGPTGRVADTLNAIIELNEQLAAELTRVADEGGKRGRLRERAVLPGAKGAWSTCVRAVNELVADLGQPVSEVERVIGAVAKGDLSQKMELEVDGRPIRGEFLRTGKMVNTMVDQLAAFASEVTRVAREVGTEGKLGGQARVPGASGTWKDLTDNVNSMADNLTAQVRNIAEVTTAVANGDLTRKITVDVRGELLELKNTINAMVDRLTAFAGEVTRVAREVGTEGRLGGQAEVPGVSGTWKDLTDNVNGLASNLTVQLRDVSAVATAIADGDLTRKITVEAGGEILQIKEVINAMVDRLSVFGDEVTRVAREVGTEGRLGGQADVPGVAGTWKDLTDSVNGLASNLTGQVRNIADVTTAVAKGDLSRKITVDVKGEMLELKNTVNVMVDQLSAFASEVTRVAREVGTEGKLGGQAAVPGVSGTWKDLTDNVNGLAGNLTVQLRDVSAVARAIADGDLGRKITVEAGGEILQIKEVINSMVDRLGVFASEVTRVAREVGTEGQLGGQAEVPNVAGTWKDLTDNVNQMAGNLTTQVRGIAKVVTAVANGDLSQRFVVEAKGEISALADTINSLTDRLSVFAEEVTRVAREVGTEGRLGGQAEVPNVAGTWKDLTDNVNGLAGNLTNQVRNIAVVTTAVANGDLSQKITVDVRGELLELKNTVNTMVDRLSVFAGEVTRVAREVGTEGELGGQARVEGVAGTWKDLTDNVNGLAGNLTAQLRDVSAVATAIANGDLGRKITVEAGGEILQIKTTINTMVDRLTAFAGEVTRVAREVGTEGQLGGQADVPGVAGTWKDLTDNVNFMAGNLTTQVRGVADVVTAVARGDLNRKLEVVAKGEIAELRDTINGMTDTLATFADQVTGVAREVGTEGKLGGQAEVPGVSGTWKDLTDNVNQLAANLTTQVRAITEVTTAVTEGDLSKKITVEAAGEVADLKNNVNEMIRTLKDTTRVNEEQDWLKTNLAKFSQLLSGQKELVTVSKRILSELAPLVDVRHGAFYVAEREVGEPEPELRLLATYAYRERKGLANTFKMGEGLVGQCALEKERILLTEVPDNYIRISSGLGSAVPSSIVVLPVLFEGEVKAVIELASFHRFNENQLTFLDQLTESIGIVLNSIEANMRTEALLAQSQGLTQELQTQQEELQQTNTRLEQQAQSLQESEDLLKQQQETLQQTNAELEDKARLLADQKAEVEQKNLEIEQARVAVEEKAEQLAVSSRYKSEFLANMSHELRTPLNSMLILSRMLSENNAGSLTQKQVEYAETIYSSGSDLLGLINEILDLSKIESGTMAVEIEPVSMDELQDDVDRLFRETANEKGLAFEIVLSEGLPEVIETDEKRLQQVLKNLLSNAFKFTSEGGVTLRVAVAEGVAFRNENLRTADRVLAFAVEDTGIGVSPDKHRVIFEAFQQGDGSVTRTYGGTGLGLSISREIARLLGGEIRLVSEPGEGSTFTLYLPERYTAPAPFATEGTAADVGGDGALTPTGEADLTDRSNGPSTDEAAPGGDGAAAQDTRGDDAPVEHDAPTLAPLRDDRHDLGPDDRILLIVEDDTHFARVLLELAHESGFKVIVAPNAEAALAAVRRYRPHTITLDLKLPGMNGLALLDRLKNQPETRHIPVHIVSVTEPLARRRRLGAVEQLQKPVTHENAVGALDRMKQRADRPVRHLLVVEDNDIQRALVEELIGGDDVQLTGVARGADALKALTTGQFDAALVDLGLPDMDGFELITRIREELGLTNFPIIVHSGRDLTPEETEFLHTHAEAVVAKDADAFDRLLDETALYLHRLEAGLPDEQRERIQQFHRPESTLAGKKVLVVDDDHRNIFALTSLLEANGLVVAYAESGPDGIAFLEKSDDVDAVLMDVMMPGMDGLEATRRIRQDARFTELPVIAVTAKAMKGDREKCLEAGCSDYITKPVNVDQLVSVLRVWIGS